MKIRSKATFGSTSSAMMCPYERQERKRVRKLVKILGFKCKVSMEEKAAVRQMVRASPHRAAPGPDNPVRQFDRTHYLGRRSAVSCARRGLVTLKTLEVDQVSIGEGHQKEGNENTAGC